MGAIFAPVQRFEFANSARRFCAEEILRFPAHHSAEPQPPQFLSSAHDTQAILCNNGSYFRDERARIIACQVILCVRFPAKTNAGFSYATA